jgi:hypothetical protein
MREFSVMLRQIWRFVITRAIARSKPGEREGLLRRYAPRNDVKIKLNRGRSCIKSVSLRA